MYSKILEMAKLMTDCRRSLQSIRRQCYLGVAAHFKQIHALESSASASNKPSFSIYLLPSLQALYSDSAINSFLSLAAFMASFLSTAACPMATLSSPSTRIRSAICQQTTFSTTGSPLVGGLKSSVTKFQFLKAANQSSNRSGYFKTAISCSAAQPETLLTVQSTIAKQLSIDVSTVAPETKFADLGADSLDTVEIMMALEEQFGVSIGEGGAENIATVQDAADLIEKVKAASS